MVEFLPFKRLEDQYHLFEHLNVRKDVNDVPTVVKLTYAYYQNVKVLFLQNDLIRRWDMYGYTTIDDRGSTIRIKDKSINDRPI